MHIPEGFLNIQTVVITQVTAAGSLLPALRRVNARLSSERVPLLGLAAAFLFTVQIFSFPVPGGTSVHISGVVLVAFLLGSLSAYILTAAALFLHLFLFQHGGISSFGANLMNIGLLPCLFVYLAKGILPAKNRFLWVAGLAWLAKLGSAFLCAVQLHFSGFIELKSGAVAMTISHFFGGAVEAVVTLSFLNLIQKIRPELLEINKV